MNENERRLSVILIVFYCINVYHSFDSRHFSIDNLPLWPKEIPLIEMHSGHLPVDVEENELLFFWHFASKYSIDRNRTVIWLNGGPGCSSLVGAWMEIGPLRFQNEETLVANPGSWHSVANLLFIDQPIGTGFSYSKKNLHVGNLTQLTNQLFQFLRRYVRIFPQLIDNEIYLAGESFAGQYIPYLSKMLLEQWPDFRLRGVLLGSAYIDPLNVYQSYLPFAIENKFIEKDSRIFDGLSELARNCIKYLSERMILFQDDCASIVDVILRVGAKNDNYEINKNTKCVNMYNTKSVDSYPSCGKNAFPDMKYMSNYFQRADVLSQLHISNKTILWTPCSDPVFDQFSQIEFEASVHLLPYILERIPIVLYNGQHDFVCNYLSIENMLTNLTWNRQIGFNQSNANKQSWIVHGQIQGYFLSARNLTYILYYDAGHLIPYEFPEKTLFMFEQFLQRNFSSISLNQTSKRFAFFYQYIELILTTFLLFICVLIWSFICLCKMKHYQHNDENVERTSFINKDNENIQLSVV